MDSSSTVFGWRNIRMATMQDNGVPYGLVEQAALVIQGSRILWCGREADLPAAWIGQPMQDGDNLLVTPGLIDCHTHLIFAGDRAWEFEQRLNDVGYEEIALRGGGINATVLATRGSSDTELLHGAVRRLNYLIAEGVTTVEIKSGYGLDLDTEMRLLGVAVQLADILPVDVCPTFLGAHALPAEYRGRADTYIEFVCSDMIPLVAERYPGIAVDAFCESIGFDLEQTRRVLETALEFGLDIKLHAEQLSNLGGSEMAARLGAMSVDHLEYTDERAVQLMTENHTVAVLLPGAFYYLREQQKPPVGLFRGYGTEMAIATDLNPGSSPVHSLLTAMNLACVQFSMTPEEALAGVTRNAAAALRLDDRGQIRAGLRADLAFWNIEQPVELCYPLGLNACVGVIQAGQWRRIDNQVSILPVLSP